MGISSYERKVSVSPIADYFCSGNSTSGEHHLGQVWNHHGQSIATSRDLWPAVIAGCDMFSFWSPKAESHSFCFTKEEPGILVWLFIYWQGKGIWLWRLRTLNFLNSAFRGNCHQVKHQYLIFQKKYLLFQMHFKHFVNLNMSTRPFFFCRKREFQKMHLSNAIEITEQHSFPGSVLTKLYDGNVFWVFG